MSLSDGRDVGAVLCYVSVVSCYSSEKQLFVEEEEGIEGVAGLIGSCRTAAGQLPSAGPRTPEGQADSSRSVCCGTGMRRLAVGRPP